MLWQVECHECSWVHAPPYSCVSSQLSKGDCRVAPGWGWPHGHEKCTGNDRREKIQNLENSSQGVRPSQLLAANPASTITITRYCHLLWICQAGLASIIPAVAAFNGLSDDIVMFRYLSLKCLCAQVISTSKLPYKGEVCIDWIMAFQIPEN